MTVCPRTFAALLVTLAGALALGSAPSAWAQGAATTAQPPKAKRSAKPSAAPAAEAAPAAGPAAEVPAP